MTDDDHARTSSHRASPSRPRLSSDDVFHGQREVVIIHGGQDYLLRITKSNKLILTK